MGPLVERYSLPLFDHCLQFILGKYYCTWYKLQLFSILVGYFMFSLSFTFVFDAFNYLTTLLKLLLYQCLYYRVISIWTNLIVHHFNFTSFSWSIFLALICSLHFQFHFWFTLTFFLTYYWTSTSPLFRWTTFRIYECLLSRGGLQGCNSALEFRVITSTWL